MLFSILRIKSSLGESNTEILIQDNEQDTYRGESLSLVIINDLGK